MRYTCPDTCKVDARLVLRGKTVGSGRAKHSKFTTGRLTIRLASRARKRLKRGKLQILGELRVHGKKRRFTSRVNVR